MAIIHVTNTEVQTEKVALEKEGWQLDFVSIQSTWYPLKIRHEEEGGSKTDSQASSWRVAVPHNNTENTIKEEPVRARQWRVFSGSCGDRQAKDERWTSGMYVLRYLRRSGFIFWNPLSRVVFYSLQPYRQSPTCNGETLQRCENITHPVETILHTKCEASSRHHDTLLWCSSSNQPQRPVRGRWG